MRSNIKKYSRSGARALAPGARTKLRTKAVVIRFKANDAAQRTDRDELHDSLKIAIVAAILVNGEHAALLLCKLNKSDRFFESGGEGFVDQYIASVGKTLLGKREVRIVRCGNDHQADFFDGQKFI